MKIIKKLLWIFLIIFPFSNSFGSVTFNQTETFDDGQDNINGLTFNDDGTKIFKLKSSRNFYVRTIIRNFTEQTIIRV